MDDIQAAKGLGYFSLGLGAAEFFAPKWLQRKFGVVGHDGFVRALGAREIAAGIGVLAQDRPAASLWARFTGDLMDLAVLRYAFKQSLRRGRLVGAVAAVLGVTVLDALYARRMAS